MHIFRNEMEMLESSGSDDGDSKIPRLNLSHRAGEKLKLLIMNQTLKPRTRLLVDVWADRLGVSRTPVREGLRELVNEGLVVYDGKSYFVKEFSRNEIKDIFKVRSALELLAVQEAANNISEAQLQQLRSICREAAEALPEADIDLLLSFDIRFHDLVYEASTNKLLQRITMGLREQFLLSHRWSITIELLRPTVNDHAVILEHLEQRDAEGAAEAMQTHLNRLANTVLQ